MYTYKITGPRLGFRLGQFRFHWSWGFSHAWLHTCDLGLQQFTVVMLFSKGKWSTKQKAT